MASYFMPRGRGAFVSVLLPSRERVSHLAQSIDSLWSLASEKGSLEFCIKCDEDDYETIKLVNHLEKFPELNIKKIISPRGNGYPDMHLWINDLSKISTGDWLFLWNDDARMKTQNWDRVLAELIFAYPWFGVWDVATIRPRGTNEFIFLRRKAFEILGHYSLSPCNDAWILGVLQPIKFDSEIAVEVQHFFHEIQDDMRKFQHRQFITFEGSASSLEARKKMAQESIIILDYLRDYYKNAPWVKIPSEPGWYYWDYYPNLGQGRVILVDRDLKTYGVRDELRGGQSTPISEAFAPIDIKNGRLLLVNPI